MKKETYWKVFEKTSLEVIEFLEEHHVVVPKKGLFESKSSFEKRVVMFSKRAKEAFEVVTTLEGVVRAYNKASKSEKLHYNYWGSGNIVEALEFLKTALDEAQLRVDQKYYAEHSCIVKFN